MIKEHTCVEQCFLGIDKPTKEKFTKIRNCHSSVNKPIGGLWTTDHLGEGKCEWGEFVGDCNFNEEYYTTAWIINIKDNAKVLVIDSLSDYEKIKKRYTVPMPKGYESYIKFARNVARDRELDTDISIKLESIMASTLTRIDFKRIAKKYDVIKLTQKGMHETSDFRSGNMMLCGWDVPCCLILNWKCIRKVEKYEN